MDGLETMHTCGPQSGAEKDPTKRVRDNDTTTPNGFACRVFCRGGEGGGKTSRVELVSANMFRKSFRISFWILLRGVFFGNFLVFYLEIIFCRILFEFFSGIRFGFHFAEFLSDFLLDLFPERHIAEVFSDFSSEIVSENVLWEVFSESLSEIVSEIVSDIVLRKTIRNFSRKCFRNPSCNYPHEKSLGISPGNHFRILFSKNNSEFATERLTFL